MTSHSSYCCAGVNLLIVDRELIIVILSTVAWRQHQANAAAISSDKSECDSEYGVRDVPKSFFTILHIQRVQIKVHITFTRRKQKYRLASGFGG